MSNRAGRVGQSIAVMSSSVENRQLVSSRRNSTNSGIAEACIISAPDAYRGETVKAGVVLREAFRGQVSEQDIVDWAHGHMAAYKSPRLVSFVDSLPKSGTGKVQWRALQEQEPARTAG